MVRYYDSSSSAELRYEYYYDVFGRLAIYNDIQNNQTYYYAYNSLGKVTSIRNQDNDAVYYEYNEIGNLSSYSYNINDNSRTVNYNYDTTNKVYDATEYVLENGDLVTFDYTYNGNMINRLQSIETIIDGVEQFEKRVYYDDTNIINNGGLSTRPNLIVYSSVNGPVTTKYFLRYEYNNIGNIISEEFEKVIYIYSTIDSQNILFSKSYEYDELNQLIRENNCMSNCSSNATGYTNTYEYDNHGNRTTLREYNYTTNLTITGSSEITGINPLNILNYEFYNSWDDQLTEYDNWVLTYDNQGNLDSMIDSNAGASITYQWEGRQLIRYDIVEDQGGGYITYQYNDEGIRIGKKVWGTQHNYYLDGDRVIYEEYGTHEMYYTYNIDGSLISVNIDGNEYFYQRNLTNDIIGLYDVNGNLVVRYEYDAWGNIVEPIYDVSGINAGELNPYRYKGYRYDTETNLYYLNSRYYNPETGRFLNADGYIGSPGEILSHNMYIYVKNNPVMYTDSTGYIVETVLDVGFALWSLYDLINDPSWANAGWFALDLLCLTIPFIPAGGKKLTKAITKVDDIQDASRLVNNGQDIIVIGQSMSKRIIPYADEFGFSVYKGLSNYDDLAKTSRHLANGIGYWDNMAYIGYKSMAGANFIDYGMDISRIGTRGYNWSRFTIYSERLVAQSFRTKNALRFGRQLIFD